jgi:hypothetical protein
MARYVSSMGAGLLLLTSSDLPLSREEPTATLRNALPKEHVPIGYRAGAEVRHGQRTAESHLPPLR